MKANEYFDSVAQTYNKNRTSGIHGYFANKEMKLILKMLDVKKNEEILDAGCGSGLYSKIIKDLKGIPYGIDLSKKMIENLKKNNIKGEVANLENFNLNKKFDKVLCVGAFEFLQNQENAVKSIKKHLKKNCEFILLYPRRSLFGIIYFMYHFILHGIKIKLFNKKLISLLEKNDFNIIDLKKADLFTNVIKVRIY